MSTTPPPAPMVEFIQNDRPPLIPGTYTVTATHQAGQGEPDHFKASTTFAVSGERFAIDAAEVVGVFPPDLANGEYAGSLPHVLLSRRTLPWERESVPGVETAPWLAVLTFDEGKLPELVKRTVADLVPAGTPITVTGSTITGTGKMPAGITSYPGLAQLDYGETPSDPVTTIDVPSALFSEIAPAAVDLPYLGHIRKVDDVDTADTSGDLSQLSVVLGNRLPASGAGAHAALVSIEGLGPMLPSATGTRSHQLTNPTLRLTAFRVWRFFANTGGETFQQLLEDLNAPPSEHVRLTSMQVPFAGPPPSSEAVQAARAQQAAGTLDAAAAQVLLHDGFGMGYMPLEHHLRRGGRTVSWYRGPLAPSAIATRLTIPLAGPDEANRYDPQTGMFDVSYGAAWQLGQLLALREKSFALAVLGWRRQLRTAEAAAAEQKLVEELLAGAMDSVVRARAQKLKEREPSAIPEAIVQWLAQLRLLGGVPFNYIVPDERMLAPESLRVFHLDAAWIQALLDGALSIGRATTGELTRSAQHVQELNRAVLAASRTLRRNRAPQTTYINPAEEVTGLIMRSQIVSGWPRLSVKGFADVEQRVELPKLKMEAIGEDVLLVLFDGVLADFAIREAPEQLHCGVEEPVKGRFSTTLRDVTGPTPGRQFLEDPKGGTPDAVVPARSDAQTLSIAEAAAAILAKLNDDFEQGLDPSTFTSAEFALEMVKGVDDVEFRLGA